jgi:hypothetical protein
MTPEEQKEQKHDRGELDKLDIRIAALKAALDIVIYIQHAYGDVSGEKITEMIIERFQGFEKTSLNQF